MGEYKELQEKLGHSFNDVGLLKLALTHPSVAHEQNASLETNQRLEFLGDAVLQLVLTRELYERFSNCGEGPLTKARAKMVNRRSLAERGRELELGKELIVSRGEELHGGRDRQSGGVRGELAEERVVHPAADQVHGPHRAPGDLLNQVDDDPVFQGQRLEDAPH